MNKGFVLGNSGIVSLLRRKMKKKGFLSNVFILAGGTAVSQGLIFAASPILTRIYSPDDFGLLAVYVSVLSILSILTSLRYELAIPLAKEEEEARSLLAIALLCVVFISAACGIGLYALTLLPTDLEVIDQLKAYMWMFPVSLFGIGVYKAFNHWAIRKKAFGKIAKTKITQSVGQSVVQIVVGLLGFHSLGLLMGDAVGRVSGSGALARLALRGERSLFQNQSLPHMRQVMVKYKKFPLLSCPSMLLNAAGVQLPSILIVMFYGVRVGGWFALVQKVIGFPMLLIGQSVAQVFLSEASRLKNDSPGGLVRLYNQTAIKLFLIGVPPMLLFTIFGPFLFTVIFGSSWAEAGAYAQVLSIMFLLQFIVSPLSQALNIVDKQGWQFMWDAGRMITVIGLMAAGHYLHWGAITAIIGYGISMGGAYLLLLVLSKIAIVQFVRKETRMVEHQ